MRRRTDLVVNAACGRFPPIEILPSRSSRICRSKEVRMKPTDGNAAGPGRDRSTATRLRGIALATLLAAAATLAQARDAAALTAQEQFLAALGKVAPFAPVISHDHDPPLRRYSHDHDPGGMTGFSRA